MLNYGDAVAHLHIARRVFDSHRPGLSQLGSVWLPLPHLLLMPFVAVYRWWANGIAGLIPSSLAYLAACAGIYRLARHWLRPSAAVVALVFFAINPNLLYLQTTAMTEPLFLCEMIWLVVWLVEWRQSLDNNPRRAARLLYCIALVLVAAIFTRYDGWILALLGWTAIGIKQMRRSTLRSRTFWFASAAVVAAPIIWFTYNGVVFGDWLDFARGPYSAEAIELRTASPGGGPPHPGWHNPWVSLLFFVKAPRWTQPPQHGATPCSYFHCSAPCGHVLPAAIAPFSGHFFSGSPFPSTPTPSPLAPYPSSCPSGGLTPGTTRVTAWNYFPPSRSGLRSWPNLRSP